MNSQTLKKFANSPCELLSSEENEAVFALLGPKCVVSTYQNIVFSYFFIQLITKNKNCNSKQTLSTAVVEIFTTVSPLHSKYLEKIRGIACFVRDSNVRSHFIRLYCLVEHKLIYEEEMYISIKLSQPRPYLICFEGKVSKCVIFLK